MNTIHDLIRESASTQERKLASIDRPSLHGRVRLGRAVRHARIAAGAAAGAGALAVGAVLVVPVVWPHNTTAIATLTPAGRASLPLAADGSLLTVVPAGNVVVDIYLDPMCPVCGQFATTIEPELLALDGVTVVYHPISILDRASSDGSYSTRASSAIQEVAAGSPDRLGAFLQQLWAGQPAEGSTLTDDKLTQLALDARVPADVASLFGQHRFAKSIADATDAASAAGLVGVPTVYIDGEAYDPSMSKGWDTLVADVERVTLERQLADPPSAPGTDLPARASASAPPSEPAVASAPESANAGASQAP